MRRLFFVGFLAFSLCLGNLPAYDARGAVRIANWIGGAGSNYSVPANWDLGGTEIPINNLTDTFIVNIPASVTINFDVAGSGHQVEQLTLAAGSTLNINPGRDLEVLDSAGISGLVTVNNSTFLADHPSSTLAGSTARLQASGSGSLNHAGTTYNATGIVSGAILSADGTTTTLNLAALQTINATNDPFVLNVRSVSATNFGTIDLSALLTVNGPGGDDRFDFITNGGGSINLSSLNTLTGNVRFQTDTAVLNVNSLTSAQNMTFTLPVGATVSLNSLANQSGGTYSVPTGGTFNLMSLASLENSLVSIGGAIAAFNAPLLNNVNNSRFALSNGATHVLNVQPTYTLTNLANITVMSAAGAGTSLDASTIQTVVATNDPFGANTRTFSATGGGSLNLSGLTTVNGPGGDDKVEFVTNTGGTVDLSALIAVTGNVRFTTDAANYSLPQLTNTGAITFGLSAGATLNLPELVAQNGGSYTVPAAGQVNLPKLTLLNNSAVTIGNGGAFDAPLLTDISGTVLTLGPGQTLNTATLNTVDNARIVLNGGVSLAVADTTYINSVLDSGDMFSADGAGTSLDLSSFTSISSTQNPFGAQRRNIRATAGGAVDLSNITTLAGPGGDDRIDFISVSGGTIDLSNLQNIATGNFLFQSDATAYSLPALAHAAAVTFALSNNATLDLPQLLDQTGGGYDLPIGAILNLPKLTSLTSAVIAINDASSDYNAPNLTNINETRITLSNGATLAIAASTYTANSLGSATLMSVSGVGTELDVSSIWNIDSAANLFGANVRTFTATSNARLELSGVTQVMAPGGDERLDFLASSGGVLDMSSLQTIAAGNTRFAATAGGQIRLGGLTTTASMNLSADGNTSIINAQYLHLGSNASFALTAGAKLELAGSFTHSLTSEAAFNADAGIIHMQGDGTRLLEVAGADLGSIPTANNFGFAQLVVGSDATTTNLILTDLLDNGNRASPEALYLVGSGGLDGLQLLNNSILRIGNIPVYALIGGVMTELHSLFAEGQLFIHYTNFGSNGFIVIGEPTFAGDYNNDGTVDAADYVVWRKYLGTLFTTGHYDAWRTNFGAVLPPGAGGADLAAYVPEPATLGMLLMAVAASLPRRRTA